MSSGPDNLFQLMTSLLTACGDALTAVGQPQQTQYVYPGQGLPPALCSSLVVGPGSPVIFSAVPMGSEAMPTRASMATPRSAALSVYSYRCLESSAGGEGITLLEIDPDAYAADALAVYTDAYTLHKGILAAHYAGTFGNYTTALSIGEVLMLPPLGGIGGCQVNVRSELS